MTHIVKYTLTIEIDHQNIIHKEIEFTHHEDLFTPGKAGLDALKTLEMDKLNNDLIGLNGHLIRNVN